MDIETAMLELEAAVDDQLQLADDSVREAAAMVVSALRPAIRQFAARLAGMAAEEVTAQLPNATVEVVLADGEPTLVVRQEAPDETVMTESLEARMTVRLPDALKARLEEAATTLGESINTYVVKSLATSTAKAKRGGRRIQGIIHS